MQPPETYSMTRTSLNLFLPSSSITTFVPLPFESRASAFCTSPTLVGLFARISIPTIPSKPEKTISPSLRFKSQTIFPSGCCPRLLPGFTTFPPKKTGPTRCLGATFAKEVLLGDRAHRSKSTLIIAWLHLVGSVNTQDCKTALQRFGILRHQRDTLGFLITTNHPAFFVKTVKFLAEFVQICTNSMRK